MALAQLLDDVVPVVVDVDVNVNVSACAATAEPPSSKADKIKVFITLCPPWALLGFCVYKSCRTRINHLWQSLLRSQRIQLAGFGVHLIVRRATTAQG